MTLPPLTPKQQTILLLIYKYRFLDRIQIQTLMNHKDYRRINAWLADLRDKHYLEWIYSTDFDKKSRPGIYYLGLGGIRWLTQTQDFPITELRKRYREAERQESFIETCMVVADCAINIFEVTAKPESSSVFTWDTQADYYHPDSRYFFLSDDDLIRPSLIIHKTNSKVKSESTVAIHLLEIFDATMPRYRIKKRLKNYIKFLDDGDWQYSAGADDPTPAPLFVCSTLTDLIYCKRAAKRMIEATYNEDIFVYFTTTQKLKAEKYISKIWELVHFDDDDEE